VYFRFDNTPEGVAFNKLIADYGFNKQLDGHNQIAILSNGKLPKFFIKNNWYPKSVISFTNHFRNNTPSFHNVHEIPTQLASRPLYQSRIVNEIPTQLASQSSNLLNNYIRSKRRLNENSNQNKSKSKSKSKSKVINY
jgi:hypothetical protein